jgi:hypothetical protein
MAQHICHLPLDLVLLGFVGLQFSELLLQLLQQSQSKHRQQQGKEAEEA